MAIRFAFKKRRVGKERRRHRLKRNRGAHLLDHVRLGGKIKVHLHGAGAPHHIATHRPDFLHVIVHEFVAALGHERHLLMSPDRRCTKPDKADTNSISYVFNFFEVDIHLVTGLVDGVQRRTRKFKLPPGLKAHIGPILF